MDRKITIFFFLVTSTRIMHRGVKCQHFSQGFTYCQRLSLQLHLQKTRGSPVTGSRTPSEDHTDTQHGTEQQLISGGLLTGTSVCCYSLKAAFVKAQEQPDNAVWAPGISSLSPGEGKPAWSLLMGFAVLTISLGCCDGPAKDKHISTLG